jgi:hypothetical protein
MQFRLLIGLLIVTTTALFPREAARVENRKVVESANSKTRVELALLALTVEPAPLSGDTVPLVVV